MGKKDRLCILCAESRTPALSAAMAGHVECLQEAYRSLNVLNERDKFGATPMHYAARHGQLECLQWLVEYSNVSPNAAARNGSTPAHDAAATGNVECLRYLLENTKCSAQERTIEGATVLHMGCRFGRVNAVRWLIDEAGASPSDKGANDVTPVHLCAAKNNIGCLRWLTKHHSYQANQVTAHGATPVYFAAQEGSLECLQWLVTEANGDIFACAKDGMYAMHAAAQAGQFECLRYLVKDQQMSVRMRSSDGATAAHFAAAGGHIECLHWLLDIDEELATVRDNLGGTPMHDAAEEGQAVSIDEFVRRGVEMDVKDYDSITPLHLAEEHNHEDCIAILRACKEEKKEKSMKAKKAFIPIEEEEEEDLKQKELEEQQRRRLAAALIQEEEQKLEEWRKKQAQTLSLGEQLDKLKELSQSGDEGGSDIGHSSQSVLVARQGSTMIRQTEVTVQEAVVNSVTNRMSQGFDEASQLAVQAANTAELGLDSKSSSSVPFDSKSTSPIPNGHIPSELSSREVSPDIPIRSSNIFSDSEDQYRRGMSGRRKKSLLDLFRIKKKKKKKSTDKTENRKKSVQSDNFSDSDLEINSQCEPRHTKRRRWWLFRSRSPKPSTSPVMEEQTEPETAKVESAVEEPPQTQHVLEESTEVQTSTAGGGEWLLVQPKGSAEIKRRRTMEQSAREQMKEASKLVVALRKANQEKRKQPCSEDDNAQQKEDEEDLQRHRKMSLGQERPPLPPVTDQKKQRAFESAIFTTWKSDVEPFPSSRLVQESLTDELKVQQRHSTEIVLREGETTTDEEREDPAKWAKGGLSPTDEESDEEENTEWHPELTSTLPKKRRNLSSSLSAAGQWKHDGSQVPRCDEEPAEYIQVTDAREHIYEEPASLLEDQQSEKEDGKESGASNAEPVYIEPNDEQVALVKRGLSETPPQQVPAESVEDIHSHSTDVLGRSQPRLEIDIVGETHMVEDNSSPIQNGELHSQSQGSIDKATGTRQSEAENNRLQVKAKQMAERHSVDLDQSLHEVTMQEEFEQRLLVAEETSRQLKEQRSRRTSQVIAAASDDNEKTRQAEESRVMSEVKAEQEEEKRQRDDFQRRKEEAVRRRLEKEDKAEKERSLEKGIETVPDIGQLVARKQQEDKHIQRRLSPNGLLADLIKKGEDLDNWEQLRKEEEERVKKRKSEQQKLKAGLRRLSRGLSAGLVSQDSTISREEKAMEAAFLALNDSFAAIGLEKNMIAEEAQLLENETRVPIEEELTETDDLDLDLLLADLDKAITLAAERTVSGTVEQEIAYATGTRNRRKASTGAQQLTPGHTPQKSRTPQLTPGHTPQKSRTPQLTPGQTPPRKVGATSNSDMRSQLRRLVLDGQRQEEAIKRKKVSRFSSKKKKAQKTDSQLEDSTVTVYVDEGQEFSLPLKKKSMTAQMLVHKITEKTGQKLLPTLSIIESFQDLHIERRLEDHELVADVIQSWHGHKAVKLILRDTPTKYDLWEKPQLARHVLIEFCDYGVVPEMSGPLYERDNRKKVWRERLFVLEEDNIMGAATHGSTDKHNMVVVASLRNHNIYTAFGDDKTNRGPTPHCILLKPHNSTARREIVALCAPNVDTMTQWLAASTLVKFGPRLKEDYSTMRQKFAAFIKAQESSSLHY